MNTYTIPETGKSTHRVMQDLGSKGIREAISEYDELLCESCDSVLARAGETINIGYSCKRCGTQVVAFEPIIGA
jgi:hypothetical protein